jgi:hypothetical protein
MTDRQLSASGIRFACDEAQAVIDLLSAEDEQVREAAWERLFSSEGYQRLKHREKAMGSLGQPFDDATFRDFVLSDELSECGPALAETLRRWQKVDLAVPLTRSLAYLPANSSIHCTVYPVIKPKRNSFVFEVETDPALFLSLDPEKTQERFLNTLAHELHHIGTAQACEPTLKNEIFPALPAAVRTVVEWITPFGEGIAMLAAAGGPAIHPHTASDADTRDRWDRSLARFGSDLKEIERFYLDVLDGILETEDAIRERGFSFFGTDQGPWYTVGWRMAATIEQTLGRDALVESLCDPRRLLSQYNRAAAQRNTTSDEPLVLWDDGLFDNLNASR